ncbi:hypothetical protein SAMN04487905_111148 [Actinopolyspora xinjiangensis]|uniref:Uncharacterized protein n=1 Tax=Actinopolyspora xinjiangensis TaxID=405564 RepID=A0A1H0WAU1_9ACTN|nr:hypothetical protein SAMN04487905_111148 [Actinopolyspora xinjiangensis]
MTPTLSALATLALPALPITLSYVATCVLQPFKTCRACHGTGTLRSPLINTTRLCPHCHATGLRLRLGRHLYNHTRRLTHRRNHH